MMTIEALEDEVNVNIKKTGKVYSGIFQVKLNNDDWKDVSWEDIGNEKDYNLISAISSKSSMSKGDKLKFRNIDKWSSNIDAFTQLKITSGKAKIYGKLTESLTSEFATLKQKFKFANMFSDSTSLVDISKLDLSNLKIKLNIYCYYQMFKGCINLKFAPKILPVIELEFSCYHSMFKGCTSLTSAPELPATTLDDGCYQFMFSGCTSLTSAPKLPATTLAGGCYQFMFSGCTSLTSAPELPATELTIYCYMYMFSDCISLVNAPKLPAIIFDIDCYWQMFNNCKIQIL